MLINVATAIWPLYFVLALGFFAGKHRSFSADGAKELNKLAMSFALPALLFVSTATLSPKTLVQGSSALIVVAIASLSMFFLTICITHFGFKRRLPEAALAGLCAASSAGPLFGPAVLPPLFGPGSVIAVTISALVLNIIQNPIALAFLGGDDQKQSAAPPKKSPISKVFKAIKGVIIQPIVWAPLLGLAFSLFHIPLSKIFTAGFQLIGTTSSGVAIFATGLTLSASGFQITKEIIIEAAIKMIALPATVLSLGLLCSVQNTLLAECIVVSALSSGLLAMMLASSKGIYVKESASVTLITSASLVVFLPVWIFITKLIAK